MAAASHSVPTLYHIQWYSSSIPYQVLLELNIPPSTVAVAQITSEQLKADAQVARLSPRRVVPFLAFPDGTSIVESAAIVLHFLETYDTAHLLHPPPAHENRPRFLQGVVFAVAEAYKVVMGVFMLSMDIKHPDRDQTKLVPAKKKWDDVVVAHLVKELDAGNKNYYLGDEFSAADIMFGYMLMTAEYVDEGLTNNKVVKAYHERLKARPAYAKLFAPPEGTCPEDEK